MMSRFRVPKFLSRIQYVPMVQRLSEMGRLSMMLQFPKMRGISEMQGLPMVSLRVV
jgi:hypothetical protein